MTTDSATPGRKLTGHLTLRVHAPDGAPIAVRSAQNMVVRGGAELVANRLVGRETAPINRLVLGFAREAADAEIGRLTPPDPALDPPIQADELAAAIAAEAFAIDATLDGLVRIAVAAPFEAARELPEVSEAGLFADDRLYNQVVFDPITLAPGQRVTFFWDIDIPFGD
ncbi:MAG: hypothetical protein PVH47_03980 [Thiohalocapsa sp.]|jgi:hypothetical protein